MRNIYINSNLSPPTKFTTSKRSTEFQDILPWNTSEMIRKTIPISTRIVINYAMKQGIVLSLLKSQWKIRQQHDQNFPMEGNPVQNKYQCQKKEINPKSRTVRATVRDPSRKVNHPSKFIWDRKNYKWVHLAYQFHKNRLASPYNER